jgi:hypothetical protein
MVKIIWMYWHQGFDKAPTVVGPCVQQSKNVKDNLFNILYDQGQVYDKRLNYN